MLNGEDNENSKKNKQTNNKTKQSKIQHETSWVTCFMEEFSVACVSVGFFLTAANFHLSGY